MLRLLTRRPLATAMVLAVLMVLPTLTLPFWSDDFVHYLAAGAWLGESMPHLELLSGWQDPLGLFNAFRFMDGTPEHVRAFIDQGVLPWWSLPELEASLWRPLSSATILLDHQIFRRAPLGYHLHSLAWLLAVLCGWAPALRRLGLDRALFTLALVIFAIDARHFMPAAWPANRNALIAAAPALLGLAAHLRHRQDGWRPGRWLTPLGLAVGLLGGEAALGAFGYLLAYELCGRRDGWPARLRALAPSVAVGLLWAALYHAWGFGSYGSGLYLDPTRQPLGYAAGAVQRAPVLLGSALGGVPADLWLFAPEVRPALIGWGVAVTLIAAALLRAAWPALAEAERQALRWLIPGALLALLPVLATFPLDRLLLLPGLGASVGTAVMMRHYWRRLRAWRGAAWRARASGLLAPPLILSHLLLPPVGWLGNAWFVRRMNAGLDRIADGWERPAAPAADTDVLLVTASDPMVAAYLPLRMAWRGTLGKPLPRSWTLLSMAPFDHRLLRLSERSFALEPVGGRLLASAFEQLYRAPSLPLRRGQVIELSHYRIRITALSGGLPSRVEVTADRPLDAPSLRLLSLRPEGLRRVALPPAGEAVLLPRVRGPSGL